jgi:hypothetical protein
MQYHQVALSFSRQFRDMHLTTTTVQLGWVMVCESLTDPRKIQRCSVAVEQRRA